RGGGLRAEAREQLRARLHPEGRAHRARARRAHGRRAMNRGLLLLLALAGAIVLAAAALLVAFSHRFQPFGRAEKLAQVVADGIWIVTGLIAWQRRPDNRVGPLMTAMGFTDVAQQLYWHAALPFTIAALVAFLFLPVGVHLFLAFPSGHLWTRFERRF